MYFGCPRSHVPQRVRASSVELKRDGTVAFQVDEESLLTVSTISSKELSCPETVAAATRARTTAFFMFVFVLRYLN